MNYPGGMNFNWMEVKISRLLINSDFTFPLETCDQSIKLRITVSSVLRRQCGVHKKGKFNLQMKLYYSARREWTDGPRDRRQRKFDVRGVFNFAK
jgi:hypothetical protein